MLLVVVGGLPPPIALLINDKFPQIPMAHLQAICGTPVCHSTLIENPREAVLESEHHPISESKFHNYALYEEAFPTVCAENLVPFQSGF